MANKSSVNAKSNNAFDSVTTSNSTDTIAKWLERHGKAKKATPNMPKNPVGYLKNLQKKNKT